MARTRRYLTYDGKTLSVQEWAQVAGVAPAVIHNRLTQRRQGVHYEDYEVIFGKRLKEETLSTAYVQGVNHLISEKKAELEAELAENMARLVTGFLTKLEADVQALYKQIQSLHPAVSKLPTPELFPRHTPQETLPAYPLREKLQIPATPLPEQWLDMDFLRYLKKFERLAQTLDYIPGMPDMGFPCSAFYAYDPLNNPDIDVECPDEMMAANVITQCYTAITHNTYEKWRSTLFAKAESPLMRPDEDPEAIVLTPYQPFEHLKEAPRVPSLLEPADPLPAEWVEDVVTYLEAPIGKKKPNLVHWGFHDHIVATGLPEEARRRMETQGHEYIHALWPANQDKRMMDAIRLQDAARLIRAKYTEDKASSQYALYRNAIETLKFKALHGGVLQPETF